MVEYLSDELDWPIESADFDEMTFEYSARELGLDEKISPKFLDIRRLRPLDPNQPWGIFFIAFDETKLPVVALRRLLSKLALTKRSTNNSGEHASWHANDLLLISQTGINDGKCISFAHFASNPDKKDLPILKVLGWDSDDTGLKIDFVIKMLREKLVWPENPSDSEAWREQWREAFTLKNREVINSSKDMAERLAQLALAIRTRLQELLAIEKKEGPITSLMLVFKDNLISDLNRDTFSDMYAQTIAYGLLSARIVNPNTKTSDAVYNQAPITNPFLRDLMDTFLNISGRINSSDIYLDFDELGINEVVDLLDNTNMEAVLRDFGDRNQQEDPVMHFFEGFLREYDNTIRKERGVFYTPEPVVAFIVKSVDLQLRSEFGLNDGLADTTTWGELSKKLEYIQIPEGISPNEPFVQILDPATGTGTFCVEVIDTIYKTMRTKWLSEGNNENQLENLWNEYVPNNLLPRIYGYELMMAPYTIAHMKIGLKLYETGYRFESNERVNIFLTDSLDAPENFSGTFDFAIPALAKEAKAVTSVKNNRYFTVIVGNPPYKALSPPSEGWMGDLMDDYKKEPGGLTKLKEKNPKTINDIYVKFIRLSSHLVEKSGLGIIGLITNHGYLDNPTFRGMRWHLLDVFNKISVIDLHGNSRKNEITPDKKKDENIFDILQGVAIMIATKKNAKKNLGEVFHHDLWGKRDDKYVALNVESINPILRVIEVPPPQYFFVKKDFELQSKYEKGIYLKDLCPINTSGIVTANDEFSIGFSEDEVRDAAKNYYNLDYIEPVLEIAFRPFDKRFIFYSDIAVSRPRKRVMHNMINHENLGLVTGRSTGRQDITHYYITNSITEMKLGESSKGSSIFPLYIYPEEKNLFESRKINLNEDIWEKLKAISEDQEHGKPNEVDTFDYIYGYLYKHSFRKTYAQFLKSDFPYIPWPKNSDEFWNISKSGSFLRKLHLMDPAVIQNTKNSYIGTGDNKIEYARLDSGKVWINDNQYFDNVDELIWSYIICGYQPAQKWLTDRKNRHLSNEDIKHYQSILNIVSETNRVVKNDEV